MITFLEFKNKILSIKDDFHFLDEFITPHTDLHMLYLLKYACREGLNLGDVDKERFLNANTNDLIIEKSNEVLSDGNHFINISLDHILKEGKNYTYRDFFDVFGLNSQVNAELLIMELESKLGEDLNKDFESPSEPENFCGLLIFQFRTLGELLYHFNNNQKERRIISKNSWWKFWTH